MVAAGLYSPPTTRPPKTIILAFDGTAKQFGRRNTNVIRLFSLFQKDNPERQILYYQPGIGERIVFRGTMQLVNLRF